MLHPVEHFFFQHKNCFWLPAAYVNTTHTEHAAWLCQQLFLLYFESYPQLFEVTVPPIFWEQWSKSSAKQQEKLVRHFTTEKWLQLTAYEQYAYDYSLLYLVACLPATTSYVIVSSQWLFRKSFLKEILLQNSALYAVLTSWTDEWFSQEQHQKIILVFKKNKINDTSSLYFVQLTTPVLTHTYEQADWQNIHPNWQYTTHEYYQAIAVQRSFLLKAGENLNWFKFLKINALYAKIWEKCRYFLGSFPQYINTKGEDIISGQLDFLGMELTSHCSQLVWKKQQYKAFLHNSLIQFLWEIEACSTDNKLLVINSLISQLSIIKPEILTPNIFLAYQQQQDLLSTLSLQQAQSAGYLLHSDNALLQAIGVDDVINPINIYEKIKELATQRTLAHITGKNAGSNRKQKARFRGLLHQTLLPDDNKDDLATFAQKKYASQHFKEIEIPHKAIITYFFLGKYQLVVNQTVLFESESAIIFDYIKTLCRKETKKIRIPHEETVALQLLQEYKQEETKRTQVFVNFLQKKLLNPHFVMQLH